MVFVVGVELVVLFLVEFGEVAVVFEMVVEKIECFVFVELVVLVVGLELEFVGYEKLVEDLKSFVEWLVVGGGLVAVGVGFVER